MLCVNQYPAQYIQNCRTRLDQQLAAYNALPQSPALAAFAPYFFNHLTLALEASFVHRTRSIEGKDGNPCNEVRMLAISILHNNGVLSADKTIKYSSSKSILKLEIGQPIQWTESSFRALAAAYFQELEKRFS